MTTDTILTNLLIILGILVLSGSGFFLKYVLKWKTSLSNIATPLLFAATGIAVSTQLRSFREAVVFFVASILQFASFVFVSRLRQRGSIFWHSLAALGSNGAWYITMGILSQSKAYWLLFVPYIIGVIVGRTTGSSWAQYIEQKFQLKSDATRDPRFSPGQRLKNIAKEETFWVLLVSLIAYTVYAYSNFAAGAFKSVLIVVGLGLLQNFFYALNTRATSRGNNWYIMSTGICAGITFYISAIYLFSLQMPLALFIPYTLSTTLGSTSGAFFSMIIEYIAGDAPDAHLDKPKEKKTGWRDPRLPYAVILSLGLIWILSQEPLFRYLGLPVNALKFPISIVTVTLPRALVMLTAGLIFMLGDVVHTLNSRAGNRNHTGYHVVTCIPKGLMDFLRVSYLAQNTKIIDVVPVGILASCMGSLFAKSLSEKIEKWLEARMDVVDEPKKAPALAK